MARDDPDVARARTLLHHLGGAVSSLHGQVLAGCAQRVPLEWSSLSLP